MNLHGNTIHTYISVLSCSLQTSCAQASMWFIHSLYFHSKKKNMLSVSFKNDNFLFIATMWYWLKAEEKDKMRPTFRYFLFLNLFFHTICIIKSDSSSSCPTTRQQYIFVYVKDKKSVTSEKLQIKHLNTQYDCEVECVRRLECHSYDFLEAQHLCELNLNEGDNLVVAKEGWVHVQKKLVPVCIIFVLQ